MRNRPVIQYQTPDRTDSHQDQDGVIGFVFGLVGICLLLILVLSARNHWNRNWPPLLLVGGFVAAVLGLIAGIPAALQRQRRRTLALCGIVVNASCLMAQLIVVVLYDVARRAG